MKVKDGRGERSIKLEIVNIEKVRVFFKKHPNSTQGDCCAKTGLSRPTVAKAIKKLLLIHDHNN